MAPRTIAQRAAAGEIQSVQGLTREEQGELLVWARQQGVQYQEIIDRYGFTLSSEGLRTWHRNMVLNHPDRVPTFNATDDRLLLRAVELYAGGPLDNPKSLYGIWAKVREYIWANGGQTTAGPVKMKERWYRLRGHPVPPKAPRARRNTAHGARASATRGAPAASTHRSSSARPSNRRAGANTGSSSAGAGFDGDITWNEDEYEPLSEREEREVAGSDYEDEDEVWGDYPDLTKEEHRAALGIDEDNKETETKDGADDDGWEEYSDLDDVQMEEAEAMAAPSSVDKESGAKEDDNDSVDEPRGLDPRKE